MNNTNCGRGVYPHIVLRHRFLINLIFCLIAFFLFPQVHALKSRLITSVQISSSPSTEASDALARHFPDYQNKQAILVINNIPNMGEGKGKEFLINLVEDIKKLSSTRSVESYLDNSNEIYLGTNGVGSIVIVGLDNSRKNEILTNDLEMITEKHSSLISDIFPGATLNWAGKLFVSSEMLKRSSEDVRRSEIIALPVVFILLLFAFGSPIASFCPVLLGAFVIYFSLGFAGSISNVWQPTTIIQNVISLLGLALGIDYSLIIITRFREFRDLNIPLAEAIAKTIKTAGHAVLLSGTAVAVGFSALLMIPIDEVRSVGLGGCLVAISSMLFATLLLPTWLLWLDRKLDFLKVRNLQSFNLISQFWYQHGKKIIARPIRTLLITCAPLVILSLPATNLKTAFPGESWVILDAINDLKSLGRAGEMNRHQLILEYPSTDDLINQATWDTIGELVKTLEAEPEIAKVYSLPGSVTYNQFAGGFVPDSIQDKFIDKNKKVMLLQIVPADTATITQVFHSVDRIKRITPSILPEDVNIMLGGIPSSTKDYQDILSEWLPWVLGYVLVFSFLILMVSFRSALIPFKAVILNLLTVGTAFGLLVVVFQYGHGIELFGLSSPLDGIFPALPIIIFCTVFGVSMDYEVFLLTRISEIYNKNRDIDKAISEGLANTAQVITSAAAIMVSVFGIFALGRFLPVQMLGFALAIAIAVDATIVRMIISPAVIKLAGKYNWWPGRYPVNV